MSAASGKWARFFAFSNTLNSESARIIMGRRSTYQTAFTTLNADKNNVTTTDKMIDTLNHYALVYQHHEKKFSFYVNGILVGSKNDMQIATQNYSYCYLGKSDYTADGMYVGYIDEFRIVDGIAIWTDNFTPPTSAYSLFNTVNTNILVRHNGADCYIPLTTDVSETTKPYLAVRHGSTNYYAIK